MPEKIRLEGGDPRNDQIKLVTDTIERQEGEGVKYVRNGSFG